MLVLSRKKDEKIQIEVNGEIIEVTVVQVETNKVKLGIQAGKHVTILRSELVQSQPKKP